MRRLGTALLLVAVLAATPAATALAGARHHPRLRLRSADPVTIHGAGFRHHERVRVVVRRGAGDAVTKRVRASRTGSFSARFERLPASGPCGRLSVTATGRSGSHAVLRGVMHPDCVVD